MLKILGLLCVVGSASAVGFGFAAGVRRQAEQLRALQTALGQMKSETAYRMTPLPELLALVGADTDGAVGALFSRCALELRRRTSTVQFAMQTALAHTPGLSLPQSARRRRILRARATISANRPSSSRKRSRICVSPRSRPSRPVATRARSISTAR